MDYFLLRSDPFRRNSIACYPSMLSEQEPRPSFTSGQLLDSQLFSKELEFHVNIPNREEPSHFIGQGVPLLSSALVEHLIGAGVDNIQSFPARLLCHETGRSWDSYCVVNVVLGLSKSTRDRKGDTV